MRMPSTPVHRWPSLLMLIGLCLGLAAADVEASPDRDYVIALEDYTLAQVSEMHRDFSAARKHLATALAARDRAIAAYRERRDEPDIAQRLRELQNIDHACCGQLSLSQRLAAAPP